MMEQKLSKKEKDHLYYINNKERILLTVKKYREQNKVVIDSKRRLRYQTQKKQVKKYNKEYYLRNRDVCIQRSVDYQKQNRDIHSKHVKNWSIKNKAKRTASSSLRRSLKRGSQTMFLKQDKIQIENFYILARSLTSATKQAYHVDHIFPIKGKTSCGLHIPSNLQVLKGEENLRKGNKING